MDYLMAMLGWGGGFEGVWLGWGREGKGKGRDKRMQRSIGKCFIDMSNREHHDDYIFCKPL